MINKYSDVKIGLLRAPKNWLVTGCAGFIGSNLIEALLQLDQSVIGLDNFATGHEWNLEDVKERVGAEKWARFTFVRGDICDTEVCRTAVKGVDYVLHQAALGSVPRSLSDPISTNAANVTGFVNLLTAAKDEQVTSFIYAASSSTYGDHPGLPKVEDRIGKPLSPYAVTKYVNEMYADVFARCYGFSSVGLRYFNVFGERQDPDGAYAAVIPKWINSIIRGEQVFINGDGTTSRDFCFIDNVIQANLLAAVAPKENLAEVYNVAVGGNTNLNQLFTYLVDIFKTKGIEYSLPIEYRSFRSADVLHSQADIAKAKTQLGYEPTHQIYEGLKRIVPWYIDRAGR